MSTFTGEEFCRCEADTLSASGNDSHFPLQFTHSSFSPLVASICNIGERPGPRSCEVLLLGRRHRCGVLHEAPCHRIPRLVGGTDSLDEFCGPAASQTDRGDHAVADIRVDTGYQECDDRAEIPAVVLNGCARGL